MALTSRAQNCTRLLRSLKIFFEKRMRLGNSNKFDCTRLSRSLTDLRRWNPSLAGYEDAELVEKVDGNGNEQKRESITGGGDDG